MQLILPVALDCVHFVRHALHKSANKRAWTCCRYHLATGGQARGWAGVQALNVQNAGATAVLLYDDQINDYFTPASNGTVTGITLPAMSLPRILGQLLVSATQVQPARPCKVQ